MKVKIQNGLQALPMLLSLVILSLFSSHSLHSTYADFFHFLKSVMLPSVIDFVYADLSLRWECLTLTLQHHPVNFISSFSLQLKHNFLKEAVHPSPFPVQLKIFQCTYIMLWIFMFPSISPKPNMVSVINQELNQWLFKNRLRVKFQPVLGQAWGCELWLFGLNSGVLTPTAHSPTKCLMVHS